MASPRYLIIFFLLLIHRHVHSVSNDNFLRNRMLRPSLTLNLTSDAYPSATTLTEDPPYRYFEVKKPIDTQSTKPCSYLVLRHQFAFTYGQPPALANYTPPSNHGCPSRGFSKIVLEWTATCSGRQFDRIFGIWLDGVELLRSCTAEPRGTGITIIWTVQKDITRYHSLLMNNGTLAVYLGNLIDKTYTGIYDANVTIHFYPADGDGHANGLNTGNSGPGHSDGADLILPISRNLPLTDGLWFEVENANDTESKKFRIPQNVYRAVLEVYVSFHENDEFWYLNPPNEYIIANNLSSVAGNGPFREVVVSLDGLTVGGVWPFNVIYTGGINPLFWRPISGIGSFNLPSYDIEITPFLSKILDGEVHEFGFRVTNALNVWYIDANLHLWVDKRSERTASELLSYISLPLVYSSDLDFKGLDGKFIIEASRTISATGWVKSSYGKVTTLTTQKFNFSNTMIMENEANKMTVDQSIQYDDRVDLKTEYASVKFIRSYKKFPFKFYGAVSDQGNDTFSIVRNLTLAFNEKKGETVTSGIPQSSLRNVQTAKEYVVVTNNTVVSASESTSQIYKFDSSRDCYHRNISSSNYKILYDKVDDTCQERRRHTPFGFALKKRLKFAL